MPGRDDRDDPGGGVVVAIQRATIAEVKREVGETREDIERLEERVEEHADRIHRRLDDHHEKIGNLRESHARIDGQMVHLVRAYERAASVVAEQTAADLEVKKAEALALIRDRAAEHKHRRAVRRELIFKAITIAMGVWALLQTALASRC